MHVTGILRINRMDQTSSIKECTSRSSAKWLSMLQACTQTHTHTLTLSLSHSLTLSLSHSLSLYFSLPPPPHSQISVCLMIGLCHIFYCPHWAHSLDEYMALFQFMFMSTCMPICMPLCKPCRWNTSQAFGPPFPPALLFWYDNR